jgi:hypothetical protein
MAPESELDRLDPEPTFVKLESGFELEVVRLKTRQLFRLLRILTRGAGPAISSLDFSGQDTSQFGAQLLALLITAFPDAEQETISFLQSMCKPAHLVEKKAAHMTKQETEGNQELWDRFNAELFNPDPMDTLVILEQVIINEAPEFQSLGKQLRHLWKVAQTAAGFGTPETAPEAADLHLPEDSPASTPSSSTSSAAPTGGATSTSSTSPSAGSARPRRQRAGASS